MLDSSTIGKRQISDSITPGIFHCLKGAGLLASQCLPHLQVAHLKSFLFCATVRVMVRFFFLHPIGPSARLIQS